MGTCIIPVIVLTIIIIISSVIITFIVIIIIFSISIIIFLRFYINWTRLVGTCIIPVISLIVLNLKIFRGIRWCLKGRASHIGSWIWPVGSMWKRKESSRSDPKRQKNANRGSIGSFLGSKLGCRSYLKPKWFQCLLERFEIIETTSSSCPALSWTLPMQVFACPLQELGQKGGQLDFLNCSCLFLLIIISTWLSFWSRSIWLLSSSALSLSSSWATSRAYFSTAMSSSWARIC